MEGGHLQTQRKNCPKRDHYGGCSGEAEQDEPKRGSVGEAEASDDLQGDLREEVSKDG